MAAKTSSSSAAAEKKSRFLGWQDTPIHQAAFGRSTQGGSKSYEVQIKNSTGKTQSLRGSYYLLDATEAPIGRLASVAATLLMGKHRPTFTPSAGSLDSVIVINASKAYFTSDKADKKIYYWHTMYMGGLKSETARKALTYRPEEVIWEAVQGMLPKNKVSRYQLSRLKIYKNEKHPHIAQKPISVLLKGNKKLLMNLSQGV